MLCRRKSCPPAGAAGPDPPGVAQPAGCAEGSPAAPAAHPQGRPGGSRTSRGPLGLPRALEAAQPRGEPGPWLPRRLPLPRPGSGQRGRSSHTREEASGGHEAFNSSATSVNIEQDRARERHLAGRPRLPPRRADGHCEGDPGSWRFVHVPGWAGRLQSKVGWRACGRGSARGGRLLPPLALRAPPPSRLPSSPLSGSRPRAASAVERTQDTLSHMRLGGGSPAAPVPGPRRRARLPGCPGCWTTCAELCPGY